MKKILAVAMLCSLSFFCRAQQQLLSYDDVVYLINSNLQKGNNLLLSKGYTPLKAKKAGNLKYHLSLPDNTALDVEIRADGKRLYMYLITDEVQQFNLLTNSIVPYLISSTDTSGILTYKVKDLGDIYIMVNDKVPYSPIRKDYDIRIVSDKNITAYN